MNAKIIILLLAVSLKFNSKAQTIAQNPEAAKIKNVLMLQQKHWNQGSIDSFMLGYWQSEKLRFISKKGVSYGWQKVLDNYKQSYSNKEKMGRLQFNIESIEQLSPTKAFVIGSWELNNEEGRLSGWFSLIFEKIKGKWLIVLDHTS